MNIVCGSLSSASFLKSNISMNFWHLAYISLVPQHFLFVAFAVPKKLLYDKQ